MFKQLSQPVVGKLEEDGRIMLTVKNGWESSSSVSAVPYKINLCIGNQLEHLFDCYLQIYNTTIIISDIKPASNASHQKSIIDANLYLAIGGLIKFAKMQRKKRITVDTEIGYAADHLPHYGFKLFSEKECPTKSIKGILTLK